MNNDKEDPWILQIKWGWRLLFPNADEAFSSPVIPMICIFKFSIKDSNKNFWLDLFTKRTKRGKTRFVDRMMSNQLSPPWFNKGGKTNYGLTTRGVTSFVSPLLLPKTTIGDLNTLFCLLNLGYREDQRERWRSKKKRNCFFKVYLWLMMEYNRGEKRK